MWKASQSLRIHGEQNHHHLSSSRSRQQSPLDVNGEKRSFPLFKRMLLRPCSWTWCRKRAIIDPQMKERKLKARIQPRKSLAFFQSLAGSLAVCWPSIHRWLPLPHFIPCCLFWLATIPLSLGAFPTPSSRGSLVWDVRRWVLLLLLLRAAHGLYPGTPAALSHPFALPAFFLSPHGMKIARIRGGNSLGLTRCVINLLSSRIRLCRT